MANPYLSTLPIPDLRQPPPSPWGGNVGRGRSGRVGDALKTQQPMMPVTRGSSPASGLTSKEWMANEGLTMCEFFKQLGQTTAKDPTFYGDATSGKSKFDVAYELYEKTPGSDVKAFAWDCFVQGFQSVRGGPVDVKTQNDGWGLGTWAVVLGGLGAAGLFGYNYLYAK